MPGWSCGAGSCPFSCDTASVFTRLCDVGTGTKCVARSTQINQTVTHCLVHIMYSYARQPPPNTPEQQHEPSPHPHLIMCAAQHVRDLPYYNLTPSRPTTSLAGELSAVRRLRPSPANALPLAPLRRHPQQCRDTLPSEAVMFPHASHRLRPLVRGQHHNV